MTRKRRRLLALGITAAVIWAAALVLFVALLRYPDRVRNRWKANAISTINRLAKDTNWVTGETARLTAQAPQVDEYGNKPWPDESGEGWISEHLILMRNGDWMVYDSICRKSDWRIADIFVGRGSDGKWYYSTFHFCVGAVVLRFNGQPADLATFRKEYSLSEFTGQPSEKLGVTWPEWKRRK